MYRYQRIPRTVEARELRPETLFLTASWCGGQVDPGQMGLFLFTPSKGMETAYLGDWIVQDEETRDFAVVKRAEFQAEYQEIEW